MALYLYIPGQSGVHRLHPTVKLFGMLAFFVAAFACERAILILPLTLGVAALLAGSGSLPNVGRLRILFVLVFVMTFVIWTLFYRQGDPLFTFGPISVSEQSLRYALGMALKLTTFLAVGTLFLSTA